ncbi:MAG: hypothetical protein ACXIUD_02060 [Mongoliitalea sp.]
MKKLKPYIFIISLAMIASPLIDSYFLDEKLGRYAYGLFAAGMFIHSMTLLLPAFIQWKKEKFNES